MEVKADPREALKYFSKLEELFEQEGWRYVIEEAKAQLYQFQADALEVRTWEEVCELRGQIRQLSRLINMEEVVAMLKEQTEEQILLDQANADL